METPIIATGAAALGLYMYLKGRSAASEALTDGGISPPASIEAWRHVEHAPNTWTETLYYFKEVFRYMYSETLGRWHTMDLFIGLAYLSHRETTEYPALDIAVKGKPLGRDTTIENELLLTEMRQVKRYLLYCRGLKFKLGNQQVAFWREHLQLDPSNILAQQAHAGLLRPAYVVIVDEEMHSVLLCVRGTQSTKDLFTSLGATTKPHHKVQANGVVLGFSHMGMLAAARWLMKQVTPALQAAMTSHKGYQLCIVGHSMGGGIAALVTTMLRETVPECADARCYAIACPACMTLELAVSCKDYVTSVINGTDIVPTFSAASVDSLREEVMHSSWFLEFQRDLKTSVFRALQGGLRGVGTATQWTARNILHPAVVPFWNCYSLTRLPSISTGLSATSAQALETAVAATSAASMLAIPGDPVSLKKDDSSDVQPEEFPSSTSSAIPSSEQQKAPSLLPMVRSGSMGSLILAPTQQRLAGVFNVTNMLRQRLWPSANGAEAGSLGRSGSSGGNASTLLSNNIVKEEQHVHTVSFGGWVNDDNNPTPSGMINPLEQPSSSSSPDFAKSDGSSGTEHKRSFEETSAEETLEDDSIRSSSTLVPASVQPALDSDVSSATLSWKDSAGAGQQQQQGSAWRWLWWQAKPVISGSYIVRHTSGSCSINDSRGVEGGQGRAEHGSLHEPLLGSAQDEIDMKSRRVTSASQHIPVAMSRRRSLDGTLEIKPDFDESRGVDRSCDGAGSTTHGALGFSRDIHQAGGVINDEDSEEGSELGGAPAGIGGEEQLSSEPMTEEQLQEGIVAVVEAMTQSSSTVLAPEGGELGEGHDGVEMEEEEVEEEGGGSHNTSPGVAGRDLVGGVTHNLASESQLSSPESLRLDPSRSASTRAQNVRSSNSRNSGVEHSVHPGASAHAAVKRHLYPAGRVLHFFPQSAVALREVATPSSQNTMASGDAGDVGVSLSEPSPETEQVSLDQLAMFMPVPRGLRPSGSDIASARMAVSQAPYVLMEVRDNRVYGRIKLCRTMVLDHLTPSYFTALDSVIQQLEEGVGTPALEGMLGTSSSSTTAGGGWSEGSPRGMVLSEVAESRQSAPERAAAARGARAVRARVAARTIMGPDGDLL